MLLIPAFSVVIAFSAQLGRDVLVISVNTNSADLIERFLTLQVNAALSEAPPLGYEGSLALARFLVAENLIALVLNGDLSYVRGAWEITTGAFPVDEG